VAGLSVIGGVPGGPAGRAAERGCSARGESRPSAEGRAANSKGGLPEHVDHMRRRRRRGQAGGADCGFEVTKTKAVLADYPD